MSKILITGSHGFIGSHLVQALLPENKIITVNIGPSKKNKNIKSIIKNIEQLSFSDIPDNIEGIIHLAAITDVDYCNKNPQKCFHTNVLGTLNILEVARKKKCPLILMSTSHVYGIPKKIPIRENHPTHPTSIYSTSKLEAEILCEGYAKTYEMDISILRLFSVYGPNSPSHLVTSRIISQLKNKSINLGNVTSKRDFIYIDDVINAIILVLNKSKGFNIYNVGTGKSHSILEVCKILKKISNSKSLIKSVSEKLRNSDANNIVSDCSKIKKIGWNPSFNLENGLKKLLNQTQNKMIK